MNDWLECIQRLLFLGFLGYALGRLTSAVEEIEHNTRIIDMRIHDLIQLMRKDKETK